MSDVVKKAIRDIPDFPKKGIIFKDITPVLKDPVVFAEAMRPFFERYEGKGIDLVASVESRGFVFGGVLAHRLGCGFIPARKPGKLPYRTIRESYSLEYGTGELEIHEDALSAGKKVLVLDDLLATGGTAKAVCNLVERLGGKVVECAFLVELAFLHGREFLRPHPVFSVVLF